MTPPFLRVDLMLFLVGSLSNVIFCVGTIFAVNWSSKGHPRIGLQNDLLKITNV